MDIIRYGLRFGDGYAVYYPGLFDDGFHFLFSLSYYLLVGGNVTQNRGVSNTMPNIKAPKSKYQCKFGLDNSVKTAIAESTELIINEVVIFLRLVTFYSPYPY